jgi:Zn-finger nucleic acid-binding protein
MNVPDAVHCSGCGRRLGLEPLGQRDQLKCPHCQQPFEAFSGGPGLLHDCATCGGQFVEHALLRDLLERREVYGQIAPRPQRTCNPATQRVRYIPCPACGALMNRRNFGRSSGVIVDICHQHGVWFDSGELPRVLAFVEAGGLQRARRREQEERRLQRATGSQPAMVLPASTGSLGTSAGAGPTTFLEDCTEAAASLLGFVSDLLGRD